MTVAKGFHRLKPHGATLPRRLLVTDSQRLADPCPVIHHLRAGDGVLFRHYDHPQRQQIAQQVASLCRQKRLFLLVAGDWRLAARVRADGIHLPQWLAEHGILAPMLGWLKHRRWGGMACHSRLAIGRAKKLRLDYGIVSPVFSTRSHPGAPFVGGWRFAIWSRQAHIPLYAMGGITQQTGKHLRFAHGTAAISAFL